MKLYRISEPGCEPILVDPEENDAIVLGEEGRGRQRVVVPMTGRGSEVHPKKTDAGVVLVRGEFPAESRCVIVIDTVHEYDRHRLYGMFDAENISVVCTGIRAFGEAGRTGGGEEVLAIAQNGAEFRLKSKYSASWYRWDGKEWGIMTPEERQAQAALRAFQEGGGEWL